MNPNHDSKTVWPGARAARRRLWRITLVLFPLSLVIFALLVGDWKLNVPERTEESRRHLIEWLVILVAAIAVTFLAGLLPTVQRFSGWLFSRRVVRRMLIAFAWLVTVVVLFYAEENWRGWHAWNRYRQPLAAQGEQCTRRPGRSQSNATKHGTTAPEIAKTPLVLYLCFGSSVGQIVRSITYTKLNSTSKGKDVTTHFFMLTMGRGSSYIFKKEE